MPQEFPTIIWDSPSDYKDIAQSLSQNIGEKGSLQNFFNALLPYSEIPDVSPAVSSILANYHGKTHTSLSLEARGMALLALQKYWMQEGITSSLDEAQRKGDNLLSGPVRRFIEVVDMAYDDSRRYPSYQHDVLARAISVLEREKKFVRAFPEDFEAALEAEWNLERENSAAFYAAASNEPVDPEIDDVAAKTLFYSNARSYRRVLSKSTTIIGVHNGANSLSGTEYKIPDGGEHHFCGFYHSFGFCTRPVNTIVGKEWTFSHNIIALDHHVLERIKAYGAQSMLEDYMSFFSAACQHDYIHQLSLGNNGTYLIGGHRIDRSEGKELNNWHGKVSGGYLEPWSEAAHLDALKLLHEKNPSRKETLARSIQGYCQKLEDFVAKVNKAEGPQMAQYMAGYLSAIALYQLARVYRMESPELVPLKDVTNLCFSPGFNIVVEKIADIRGTRNLLFTPHPITFEGIPAAANTASRAFLHAFDADASSTQMGIFLRDKQDALRALFVRLLEGTEEDKPGVGIKLSQVAKSLSREEFSSCRDFNMFCRSAIMDLRDRVCPKFHPFDLSTFQDVIALIRLAPDTLIHDKEKTIGEIEACIKGVEELSGFSAERAASRTR